MEQLIRQFFVDAALAEMIVDQQIGRHLGDRRHRPGGLQLVRSFLRGGNHKNRQQQSRHGKEPQKTQSAFDHDIPLIYCWNCKIHLEKFFSIRKPAFFTEYRHRGSGKDRRHCQKHQNFIRWTWISLPFPAPETVFRKKK